jgi:hypothetical protein
MNEPFSLKTGQTGTLYFFNETRQIVCTAPAVIKWVWTEHCVNIEIVDGAATAQLTSVRVCRTPEENSKGTYFVPDAEQTAPAAGELIPFGTAMELVKREGLSLTRLGWVNAKPIGEKVPYVFLIEAAEWTFTNARNDNAPLQRFFAIRDEFGAVAPWTPTLADMLADDWVLTE